jgi:filamentous hemagglutinin family protein
VKRTRIVILVVLGLLLGAAPARAQGPTITPSGLGTTVTPPPGGTGTYEITGGSRGGPGGDGPNLFHSFGRFSIGALDTARFNNTTPALITRNILSRVTGGEVSSIYGTIDSSSYLGANLFLINPAGVIFGPSAMLNVAGSFHVTSADYIRFVNGETFCVSTCPNGQASVLSVADPASFGFLGPRGPITVEGAALLVPAEKTLGIVGGAVTISGAFLQAPSGRLQVASATGGEVSIATLEGATARGQVRIAGGSTLDASGDPPGSVVIRGGQLTIDGAFISANTFGELNGTSVVGIDLGATQQLVITNSSIVGTETFAGGRGGDVRLAAPVVEISGSSSVTAATSGAGRGGDVDVTADSLRVTGFDASLGTFTQLSTVTQFGGGQGGDMRITVGRPADGISGALEITDGALVDTRSVLGDNALLGTGGGSLTVTATGGSVKVAGGGALDSVNVGFTGPGGNVAISAGSITISGRDAFGNSSRISSTTVFSGDGGGLSLSARTVTVGDGGIVSSQTVGDGRAGDISVSAGSLNVVGGSTIGSNNAGSAQRGGNVTVTVTGPALISGAGIEASPTGIFTTSLGTTPAGDPAPAGSITLDVGSLDLSSKAVIQSGDVTLQGGGIAVTAHGPVNITDRAGISSQTFLQDVGSVTLSAPTVVIDGGFINSSTLEAGRAGSIVLNVGSLLLTGGGQIASSSVLLATGPAGNINVTAGESITITGASPTGASVLPVPFGDFVNDARSGIFSTTANTGPGGNITLRAPQIRLVDGGTISASSLISATGPAGQIDVTASESITIAGASPFGDSGLFSTTAGTGPGGNITLRAGQIQLAGGGIISSASTGELPGSGPSGHIDVTATGSVTISGASPFGDSGLFSTTVGTGPGGNITLRAGQIQLAGGGIISSASTGELPGSGPAGHIDVSATGSVTISGASPFGESGLFSTTSGTGPGGNITLRAPQIQLVDGGTISAASVGVLPGSGPAGNIDVTAAESVTIAGTSPSGQSGLFSTTAGTGPGGNITLRAPQIRLADGGTISASSTGGPSATAGSIDITFGEQFVLDHASISTDSLQADGGNITIVSTGSLLHLIDSQITTSVRSGVGGGGNITLGASGHPLQFLVLDHGGIHADAFGGPGGNINIFANVLLSSTPIETAITASSRLSAPGTVNISAVVTDISQSVPTLSTEVLAAAVLLRASCAARMAEGKTSSLVVAGREGVPLEPGGLVPSMLMEPPSAGVAAGSAAPFLASEWPGLRLSYLDAACGR